MSDLWLRQELRAEKLVRRAERMRAAMERQLTASWTTFEEMVSILIDFGALKPDSLELLPLGMVAREVNTPAFTPSLATTHPFLVP